MPEQIEYRPMADSDLLSAANFLGGRLQRLDRVVTFIRGDKAQTAVPRLYASLGEVPEVQNYAAGGLMESNKALSRYVNEQQHLRNRLLSTCVVLVLNHKLGDLTVDV